MFAPAVWFAVQEQLSRTGGQHADPDPTQRYLDQFDDEFLFGNFHFGRECLTFIVDLLRVRFGKKLPDRVDAAVLAALGFFATGSVSRTVMDRLGLDRASADEAVRSVSRLLAGMVPQFVTFPGSHNDRMCVAQTIKDLSRIPNVVGILGCLHVRVTPPADSAALYLNALGYTSVLTQAVCDSDGNLLSVEGCCPGGTPEQKVWDGSSISFQFRQGCHGPNWLIGGRGYELSRHIMTPLRFNCSKGHSKAHYSIAHHKVLCCGLRAFGALKSRFRCLEDLGPVDGSLDRAARVIHACCVLHNIGKKFSAPLPGQLVPEPIQPLPFVRAEALASNLYEVEIMQDDMIRACFGHSDEENSRRPELGREEEEEEGADLTQPA